MPKARRLTTAGFLFCPARGITQTANAVYVQTLFRGWPNVDDPERRSMPPDPMVDRLPPHSRDAEEGVLGGILRDPEILSSVIQIIRADNFYFDAHQKTFQA